MRERGEREGDDEARHLKRRSSYASCGPSPNHCAWRNRRGTAQRTPARGNGGNVDGAKKQLSTWIPPRGRNVYVALAKKVKNEVRRGCQTGGYCGVRCVH